MKIVNTFTFFALVLLLLCIPIQSVFWASGASIELESAPEKPQTLREYQENIQNLKQEKQRLEFKWTSFRIWNENLWDFIKTDLSEDETKKLENTILNYIDQSNLLENDIDKTIESWEPVEDIKKELLMLKQAFYKNLIVYIQIDKLDDFTSYVNSDLNFREQSKIVAIKIDQQSIQRNERVEEIQEQIEDNSVMLRKQIKDKITLKIEQKLDEFSEQEKFQNLSNEMKIQIFEKLIVKLNEKKENLGWGINTTSIIDEKIFMYTTIEEALNNYILKWK